MISSDLIEMTPEDLKDPGTQEIYQKLLMQVLVLMASMSDN